MFLDCCSTHRRRNATPLYMDIHHNVEGLTAVAVMHAHETDVQTQDKYGVKYLKYWLDRAAARCSAWSRLPPRRRQQRSTAKPTAWKPMKSSRFRKASNAHSGVNLGRK